jgi:antitoxin (DNA-binding transcriptional repressor) of toxin-antitoxin stability system
MKTPFISATEFKSHFLALLDEVKEQGGTITVKRGKPVATVGPVKREEWKSPAGALKGKFKIIGDIINFVWDGISITKPSWSVRLPPGTCVGVDAHSGRGRLDFAFPPGSPAVP